jgi:hypothetical protein
MQPSDFLLIVVEPNCSAVDWGRAFEGQLAGAALISFARGGPTGVQPWSRFFPETTAAGARCETIEIADERRRSFVEYDEVPAPVLKFLETVNRHWLRTLFHSFEGQRRDDLLTG